MISEIDIKDFPNSWKPSEEVIYLGQAPIDSVVTFADDFDGSAWLPAQHYEHTTACVNCFDEIYRTAFNTALVTVWVKD
jgi:Holliday junction resolvase